MRSGSKMIDDLGSTLINFCQVGRIFEQMYFCLQLATDSARWNCMLFSVLFVCRASNQALDWEQNARANSCKEKGFLTVYSVNFMLAILTMYKVFQETRNSQQIEDLLKNYKRCIDQNYPDKVSNTKKIIIGLLILTSCIDKPHQAKGSHPLLCCRWKDVWRHKLLRWTCQVKKIWIISAFY